jgi:hypothetical protein
LVIFATTPHSARLNQLLQSDMRKTVAQMIIETRN